MLNLKKIDKSQNKSLLKINPNIGSSNFLIPSSFNNNKNISHEIPSKITTPLDFIKNKKKFIIHNSFDINGTKDFLAQKEIAMMTINLEDDIEEEKTGKKFKKSNTNLLDLDSGNNSFREQNKRNIEQVVVSKKNNSEKKNSYSKIISPNSKKNKKSKYISNFHSNLNSNINSNLKNNIKSNIKSNVKSDNVNNRNNINFIFDHHDSENSDYLYKFIIDNANETDDNFNKKFEKVIKEVETQRQNQLKDKNDKKMYNRNFSTSKKKENKENDKNNIDSQGKKGGSIFIFSENSRKMMLNDSKIGESSIIGENNVIVSHEKDKIKNNLKKDRNNEKKDDNVFDIKRGDIDKSKFNSLKSILKELV